MDANYIYGATGAGVRVYVTWSNWGGCLDIFAPGEKILSASHLSDVGTTIKNGTSMAAPFVAGVAALYLQNATSASPAEKRR